MKINSSPRQKQLFAKGEVVKAKGKFIKEEEKYFIVYYSVFESKIGLISLKTGEIISARPASFNGRDTGFTSEQLSPNPVSDENCKIEKYLQLKFLSLISLQNQFNHI